MANHHYEPQQLLTPAASTVYNAFGFDWTKERPIRIANSLDETTAQPAWELL